MFKHKCPSCKAKFWNVKVKTILQKWYKKQIENYYCPVCSTKLKPKEDSNMELIIMIILFATPIVLLILIEKYGIQL